jgi:hypothetical protein
LSRKSEILHELPCYTGQRQGFTGISILHNDDILISPIIVDTKRMLLKYLRSKAISIKKNGNWDVNDTEHEWDGK